MHNVLIVDDEPGIRQSLKGVLEDEGYKTFAVSSAEACLDEIEKHSFDVILLDIWLPGMDGLEALEKIKQNEDGPEVIMISTCTPALISSMRFRFRYACASWLVCSSTSAGMGVGVSPTTARGR